MISAAVVTTFPDNAWPIYAKTSLQSWAKFFPKELPILVALDTNLLAEDVRNILSERNDAIAFGMLPEQESFVKRNSGKDDASNYRKQATRFCHKVYTLGRALEALKNTPEEQRARYLIWLDADVIVSREVSAGDIEKVLPSDGSPVSYLGRKDWNHSECGLIVFDIQNGGGSVIEQALHYYNTDELFKFDEWHDSFVFDKVRELHGDISKKWNGWTNLTENAVGRDVWPMSPMSSWSHHYKGQQQKNSLVKNRAPQNGINVGGGIIIETKNAIPKEEICAHIKENQGLIKNWLRPCKKTQEQIVVVSGGSMLIPEDVLPDYNAGKKIVAVKHAMDRLNECGIVPWATILLDPRPHVAKFVENASPDTIWFVASQVNPAVTKKLIERGCTIWGYHASVGAGEDELINKQEYSIIAGGSATATRGLYVLHHLGFRNLTLYGYDLSFPNRPDLSLKDEHGQPKFMEFSVKADGIDVERVFWSEPQLAAQIGEMQNILASGVFNIKAHGWGIIPFITRCSEIADLRRKRKRANIVGQNPPKYQDLLKWKIHKKKPFSTKLLEIWQKILLKLRLVSSF